MGFRVTTLWASTFPVTLLRLMRSTSKNCYHQGYSVGACPVLSAGGEEPLPIKRVSTRGVGGGAAQSTDQ